MADDYKVRFVRCEVPDLVFYDCEYERSQENAASMLMHFLELASEGVKFSFSYKEDRNAFTVGVTLPAGKHEDKPTCATFWDKELDDAIALAYIAVFLFKADKVGFEQAGEAMANRAKAVAREMQEYKRSNLK